MAVLLIYLMDLCSYFCIVQCICNPLLISVVLQPPYEVMETGWGEFEVIIKIYFNDPTERPVSCQ